MRKFRHCEGAKMQKLKELPNDEPIFVMKKAYRFSGMGSKILGTFWIIVSYNLSDNYEIESLKYNILIGLMIACILYVCISFYDGSIKQVLLYDDKIVVERNFGIYSVMYDEIIRYGNIKIGAFSRLFVFDLKKRNSKAFAQRSVKN
ncbi:hypothetical protein [Campylobacter magnus]|uniref:hypothetical protein n=1 Tax=Campylobacter magnus TaxID=3026462 RepID=UPI00235F0181|nr:hypothetical protein [Campylobacter magnus]MDD0855089.1 hypothetical protein [Campylobacter magnus]